MIFVTPHIVTDQAQAQKLRRELERRSNLPRERIRFGAGALR